MSSIAFAVLVLFVAVSFAAVAYETEVFTNHVIVQDGMSVQDVHDRLNANVNKRAASKRSLTPSDLKKIYNLTEDMNAGAGKTIALICAFGPPPNLEADLNIFATHFGLPNCTTANGCFALVNETGGNTFAGYTTSGNWPTEMALDIQAAHAIAPGAKKILVLAIKNFSSNLINAIAWAMKNADYISMSFGSAEQWWTSAMDSEYFSKNASVSMFAASGDNGAEVQWPAVSNYVVGVGGTSVFMNSDGTFAYENGWSGSGGGCSIFINGTATQWGSSAYQTVASTCKPHARALPDASMVADPYSGMIIYSSYGCDVSKGCYMAAGGTSLASPLFAAKAAVTGKIINQAHVYSDSMQIRDVLTGSNPSSSSSLAYSCGVGMDLVTGRGSWAIPDSAASATTTTTTTATTSTTTTTATTSTTTSATTTTATTTTATTSSSTTSAAATSTTTAKPATTSSATSTSATTASAATTTKPSSTSSGVGASSSSATTSSNGATSVSGASTTTKATGSSTIAGAATTTSSLTSTTAKSSTTTPTATPTTTTKMTTTSIAATTAAATTTAGSSDEVYSSAGSTVLPQVFIVFCFAFSILLFKY